MVKKISGVSKTKGPSEVSEVSEVDQVSEVEEVSGVDAVSGVNSVGGLGGVGSVGQLGQKITKENQQEVLDTIDREAEKMFKGKKIPRKRQKTITDALKMAVLAAPLDEEEESEEDKP